MKKPFSGNYEITQIFGVNPQNYSQFGLKGHNGIDYALPSGTNVLAPHDGKIIEATLDPAGYGLYTKIENDIEGSVLAHFKELRVGVGDAVSEGQLIALSDNSGNSTGPHLHWGYYRFPRNRQNGFAGFIDQTPYISSDDYFLGIDLNNKESIKVCVQAWKDVIDGKYIKQSDLQVKIDEAIQSLKQTISDKENTIINLNGQISGLEKDKNLLADELKVCQSSNQSTLELNDKLIAITQEFNQLKLDYEKAKGDWSLKEVSYNKQIALLTTKYEATKSSIKKLLVDYIFGKK